MKRTDIQKKLFIPAGLIIAFAAIVLGLLVVTIARRNPGLPEDWLLTIDGYPVSEEEFRFYLRDELALTSAYFSQTYHADTGADFWTREFDGEIPTEYAKKAALAKLTAAKQEQILADERGVAEYQSFDDLKAEMQLENASRKESEVSDGIYYGLSSFDMQQYILYTSGARWADLVQTQLEMTTMTDAELDEAFYSDSSDYLKPESDELIVLAAASGGQFNERILNRAELSKDDIVSLELWEKLAAANPGDTYVGVYLGEELVVELKEKPEPAAIPREEIAEKLLYNRAENDLRLLLSQRVRDARIKYNGTRFHEFEVR